MSLLALLPKSTLKWYTCRLRRRLLSLEGEVKALCQSLEDVEDGYEYTEGYRTHLQRRLDEANLERWLLVDRLSRIETTYLTPL